MADPLPFDPWENMKKALSLLGVVMVAGIVAVVAAMTFAGRDIPAPDTADLTIEHPDVPPEENAYTYFVSATNVLYWPDGHPWQALDML